MKASSENEGNDLGEDIIYAQPAPSDNNQYEGKSGLQTSIQYVTPQQYEKGRLDVFVFSFSLCLNLCLPKLKSSNLFPISTHLKIMVVQNPLLPHLYIPSMKRLKHILHRHVNH